MAQIPGLSKYTTWLNQKLAPQHRVTEILELGAFWTEAIVSDEKSGDQFWARLYHLEPQQEEPLKSLWQEWAYPLEDLNEDLLQKPIGLQKVGEFQAYLSRFEQGIDLKSLLKHCGHLKPNRAIIILLQAIKSLEAVYARGAAHFQLKPSNLVLTPRGSVIVKNFGLYEIENLLGKQIGAQYFWDVAYFSPEHFGDQELTIASDIYSLGLVLFEMVTGRQPFSGQYQEVMNAQMKSMPPNPQALNPEINIGLSRVMIRMLAKKKAQRFQSFSELRQALFLLLPPLEQAMFRSFTKSTDPMLDDAEEEALKSGFNEVKGLKLQNEVQGALTALEGLIRIYGVRQEFEEIALELADQAFKDKLSTQEQKAEDYMQKGYPFKALHVCQDILAVHPNHSGARSIFRKAFNLLDFRPLLALHPAIAIDLHLKLAKETSESKAMFALFRVLLSDPHNQEAAQLLDSMAGEKDPIELQLEEIRAKRDEGGFTEALAMVDALLTKKPNNRQGLLLKKQITEQIHIMSLSNAAETGETIPISLDTSIDDNFELDQGDRVLAEESILNVKMAIQGRKFDAAESELSQLEQQFPNDPELVQLRSQLDEGMRKDRVIQMEKRLRQLLQIGDDNGCAAMVREILKLEPGHVLAKATLANLEKKREDHSESHLLIKEVQAIAKQGRLQDALDHLNERFETIPRTQKLMSLKEHLEKAIKDQSERDWYLTEVQTLMKKGNLNVAEEKLNHLLGRFPNDQKALALLKQLRELQNAPKQPPLEAPGAPTMEPPASERETELMPTMSPDMVPPGIKSPPPAAPQPPAQPEPIPEAPVQPPEPSAPKAKSKLPILAAVVAVVVILAGTGGYFWYQSSEQNKRLEAQFREAERIQTEGDWEAAIPLWKALADEAPEFKNALGRLRDLETQIQEKTEKIEAFIEQARNYKEDGYFYDETDQNAIVMLRKAMELDPGNAEAQELFDDILATQMEQALALFEEERVMEARDLYNQVKEIKPDYQHAEFESKVNSYIDETVVQPALAEIEKEIKRKRWDQAIELSDNLRDQISPVPALDAMWDEVFQSLQDSIPDEKRKSKILSTLELMVKIRPDDQALVMEKNELNRELNQAKIDNTFDKMESAYAKKQWITAGVNAKRLLELDSEHETAKNRLYEVVGLLKRQAENEAKDNPSKAIATYQSLLKIENMRVHRQKISALQTKLSRFKGNVNQLRQGINKPYNELSQLVNRAMSSAKGFEKEADYNYIVETQNGIKKDQENLQKLKDWEAQVRGDASKPYATILQTLRKSQGFKFGFSKQEHARLVAYYEDKIENYEGSLSIVLKQVKNLPKGQGLRKTPDAYAEITIGTNKCVTDSVKSQNPTWNHICRFQVNKGDFIVIKVFNKGFVKKQTLIGALRLPKVPPSGKDLSFTSPEGWTAILNVTRER